MVLWRCSQGRALAAGLLRPLQGWPSWRERGLRETGSSREGSGLWSLLGVGAGPVCTLVCELGREAAASTQIRVVESKRERERERKRERGRERRRGRGGDGKTKRGKETGRWQETGFGG